MRKTIEKLVNDFKDSKINKLQLVKGIYEASNVSIRQPKKLIPKLYKLYEIGDINYAASEDLCNAMECPGVIMISTDYVFEGEQIRKNIIIDKYIDSSDININREHFVVLSLCMTNLLIYGITENYNCIAITEEDLNVINDIQEIAGLLLAPVPLLTKLEQKLFFKTPEAISNKYGTTIRLSTYIFNKYLK